MRKLVLILCLFSFFSIQGCGGIDPITPIVSGILMWVEGEAHKYYHNDSGTVYRAVKRACHELDYDISTNTPPDSSEGEQSYYLVAGGEDRFKINIRQVEGNITKLSVRVNFMGDKPYAELLYKKVDEQLNTIEFGPDGVPVRK